MEDITSQNALVAIFPDRTTADTAVQQLIGNGFRSNQIEVNSTADLERQAASGGAGLSGQHHDSSGGGIAGFFHRLFGTETDEDDVSYYRNAARRGNAAVVVHADDQSLDRAADILNRSGAVEVEERDESRRTIATTPTTPPKASQAKSAKDRDRSSIPVVQEELQVGKRVVQRGAVRVYSRVIQQPVEEKIGLREERVKVDRRATDRPATEADMAAADRDVIEMTETVEEPVVSKRARVVEEVVIGKDVNERTETVRDNVMRSEVHVEDSRGERGTSSGTIDYDTEFQGDFQSRYGSDKTLRYEDYAPAYRYGYEMANDPRYRGRRFEEIGEDLRSDYTRRYPNSTWERMKDAVRHGWDKVTGKTGTYSGTSNYDTEFQRDFQSRYGSNSGLRYEDYAPAYQYGYEMANDPRYRGKRFEEISEDLRADYSRHYPNSTWERIKDAVRYGWDKVTGNYTSSTSTTDYDTEFQRDFQSRYGSNSSLRYQDYAPAYQYGYLMANDSRYRGKRFDEVGEDLRTDYMRRYPNSTWERMKDAVRYGWDKVTGNR